MANVVITGANRGIGLELTRQYLETGDRVFAMCRTPDRADALNRLSQGTEGRVSVHAMDVADDASVRAAAEALGGETVDILINNAGLLATDKGLEERDFSVWHQAFEVMAIGPFRVAQALLPRMKAGSKIMTISSQLGASSWPHGGNYAYGAAKAAVNRVMRSLSIDLRDREIMVAMIHPGWVRTDMGGPGADISPVESASGIRAVIGGLTLETSGAFFKWNGERHSW